MYQVRPLGASDVDAFRRVRLEALRLHPEAFGSAYEDEVQLDRAQFAERLAAARFTRFGGFAGDDLVGLVGLQVRAGAKERHKGHLFSMYVDAAHRRSGLSEQLVKAVIAGARDAERGAGASFGLQQQHEREALLSAHGVHRVRCRAAVTESRRPVLR